MHARLQEVSNMDLVGRAAEGDAGALRALVERALPRLHRISRQLARNVADAEEIAQESAYVLIATLPRFERRCHLSTWLYAIVRSQVARKYRRIRALPLSSCPGAVDPTDGLAFAHAADAHADVEQLMAQLSQVDQAILVGRELEGLSSEEVARQLHLSVAAGKSRLHRTRGRLRHCADDPHGVEAA